MTAASMRRTLGRYELLERLGRGSAMEAHRAKSFGVEGFEKTLVVKTLLPELAASPEFVASFLEHVQRAMRLSHANLAQVFDLGREERDGKLVYYLATEHVSGLSVATLAERSEAAGKRIPLALATFVALEVAKALDHAHRRRDEELRPLSIVHGAVAPHNVLVSFDGDVKLTDFGVSRALIALPGAWEPLRRVYPVVSPEVVQGERASPASDVYSLGAFLYWLASGEAPFSGESISELRDAVIAGDPPPLERVRPDVPLPLSDLVQRALARAPDERFPSLSSLYEELLACTYACGLRYSGNELASVVDSFRDAPDTVPAETIGALLSRPLTVPPPRAEPDTAPDDGTYAPPTTIPPLTGYGDLRHVSVLVLGIAGGEPLPAALRERAHTIVDRYGGSAVTDAEREITAIFGLDQADGRDTELAIRAGLVLARSLDVRDVAPSVGIDAGRIRLDATARPVRDERAERLFSAARALAAEGERTVVVSRRAAAPLRGRFPLAPVGTGLAVSEFAQDGFTDAFVGRRAELTHLGETLASAARGEFRLISVVGDTGVGKTRLAVEVQRRLSRGSVELRTFFRTCPPRGREVPLSGLVAMLRRVCDVRDGDPPERILGLEPRLRALGMGGDEVQAVLSALGAEGPGGRPETSVDLRNAFLRMMQSLADDCFTVFAWDDAHELDSASVEVLERAASRLSGSRLAVVLCARRDPSAPYLSLPIHTELVLPEMTPSDVDRLVAVRVGADEVPPRLLEFLRDRAAGQPLFVEELLRQLVDGGALQVDNGRVTALSLEDGVAIPRTLRALTGDRLARLTPDEKNLFVAAAVLEPPASVAILAKMVGSDVQVVERIAAPLVSRGLLGRDGPEAFGFPSPLAREVVLHELSSGDLRKLHRKAAEAQAAVAGSSEDADRIGYHLAAAGDRDEAAGEYARSGLYHLARRKLERAALDLAYAIDLTNLDTRAPDQIENWLGALSAAVRYVRTGPALPAIIDRLVQRVDSGAVEAPLRGEMRVHLASILGSLDQQLVAEALLDRGAADATSSPDLIVSMLATRAHLAASRGEFRLARKALDPLKKAHIRRREDLQRVTLGMALALAASGEHQTAAAALVDAETLSGIGDALPALERSRVRTELHLQAGRFREAAESAFSAAAQAEELGLLYEVAASLSDQAVALARLGDTARARAAVASALATAEEAAAERIVVRCRLVLGYLEASDRRTRTVDAQRGWVAHAESRGWITDALLGRQFIGRAAQRAGSPADARSELVLASRIAVSTGNQALAELLAAEIAALG
ncbi:MAG TPA: AAA family ATPase [Polyangiaceae bacterium]|nr:AAA family ATPase [Polyangiaceae bacterium]